MKFNNDEAIIKKNLKIEGRRTTYIQDFIDAVNTWEGLEAINYLAVSESKLLRDLKKFRNKTENLIVIKRT